MQQGVATHICWWETKFQMRMVLSDDAVTRCLPELSTARALTESVCDLRTVVYL